MSDFLSQPTQDRWGVTCGHLFDESLRENTIIFPDLPDRLQRFLDFKRIDPIRRRYGKHDTRLTKKLVGFWHAHLRDDAVLIYNLKDRAINLLFVAKHSDMEGRRLLLLSDKLMQYNGNGVVNPLARVALSQEKQRRRDKYPK